MKFFRPLVFGWNLSEKIKNWYFVEIQFVFGWNFFGIWLKPNLYFVETFLVIRWNSVSISWNFFWYFVELFLVFGWNFFWYYESFLWYEIEMKEAHTMPETRKHDRPGLEKKNTCVLWLLSANFSNPFILQYETRVRARVRVRAKVGWR